MRQNLCSLIWEKVPQNAGRPWPERVVGSPMDPFDDVHETGGLQLPIRLTPPELFVGTESQLAGFTRELIRSQIPKESFQFRNDGLWKWQWEWLEEILYQHFPSTGDRPCLVWLTPVMSLIGRSLLKNSVRTVDVVKRRVVLDTGAASVPLRLGTTTFHLNATAEYLARPKNLDDQPSVHIITRSRQIVDASGRLLGRSAREQMVFLAHPEVHAHQVQRCLMPANQQFHNTDDSAGGGGWLSTPHMTIIKVEPRASSREVGWARYLAYRFHRDEAVTTSLIFGEDDFQQFVDHHPGLQRLLNRYTGTDDRSWLRANA